MSRTIRLTALTLAATFAIAALLESVRGRYGQY